MDRRSFLRKFLAAGITLASLRNSSLPSLALASDSAAPVLVLPKRSLGSTGFQACLFSLGGEGVLRSTGRMREAQAVIERALDLGVNYFDTAPAYQQSQDYYGATLGKLRDKIFLASKNHERGKDASLQLLDNSLRRLKTDRLDLWQLHDLRSQDDIDEIFGSGGAIEAVEIAKRQGKIRFAGITGHTDPAILLAAMERYAFDSVLLPVNAADKARLSFIEQVVPVARKRGMAVIGMKVMEQGELFGGLLTAQQAITYALGQDVSTIIVGCSSPAEVDANARAAADFQPLSPYAMREIEARVLPRAAEFNTFKRNS